MAGGGVLESVTQNLFKESSPHPTEFQTEVKGYCFTKPDGSGTTVDYHALLQSFRTTGFQATNFGLAVEEIDKMVSNIGCINGSVWWVILLKFMGEIVPGLVFCVVL